MTHQELIEARATCDEILDRINADPEIAAVLTTYQNLVEKHELFEELYDINERISNFDEDSDDVPVVESSYPRAKHSTPAGKPVPGAESATGAQKYVKQVNGRWALVSRHTGRPLKYFKGKPSDEEAAKALRAVEFFKHGG